MHLPLLVALAACSLVTGADMVPSQADLERMSARFAPSEIGADLSRLPASERAALVKLIEAAKLIDGLYLRQVWSGNDALLLDPELLPNPLPRTSILLAQARARSRSGSNRSMRPSESWPRGFSR